MRDIITLACGDCKRAELHQHEEQAPASGPRGVQEVLPVLPEAHAAQGNALGRLARDRRTACSSVWLEHRSPKPGSGVRIPPGRASFERRRERGEPCAQTRERRSRKSRRASLQALQEFVKEVRVEATKVSWPTREELRDSTIVVARHGARHGADLHRIAGPDPDSAALAAAVPGRLVADDGERHGRSSGT